MSNNYFQYPYGFRYFGFGLMILSIVILAYRYFQFEILDLTSFCTPFAFALMFVFFAKEEINDERIVQLKFKALSQGIPIAALIFSGLDYLVNFHGYSIETDSWFTHSAFEYLSVAFLLSLSIFEFLKWRE